MAVNPQQELVWQGRLHIGDEPGTYGDADFCGLGAELPLTAYRMDPKDTTSAAFQVVLETQALETYDEYAGHSIEVLVYEPDPTNPYHSLERVLARERFKGADNNRKAVSVEIGNTYGPFRLSVRLRSDTSVNPGYYDDFVWLKLSLLSAHFYAALGFPIELLRAASTSGHKLDPGSHR